MEQKTLSKLFWTEASTGGLVIGGAFFLLDLLNYFAGAGGIISFLWIAVLALGLFYFSRRVRDSRPPEMGYPYSTAFGFVMAVMLFTGVVYGIGLFFLQTVIAPGYFMEQIETQLLSMPMYSETMVEEMLNLWLTLSAGTKLFIYLFAGIFMMVIYGGLVGLIVSVFVKRPPVASPNHFNSEE